MPKFRKKPVVIEAEQFDTDKWQLAKEGDILSCVLYDGYIGHYIRTLEGNMTVKESDYVIRGIKGEFYPCRKDIFEETYEPVD